MIPISDTLRDLFKGESPQVCRITLTPTTGSAVTITEADIVQGSFYINRACTASESLELGSVIASEFGCTLFNDGKFDDVEFEGAELYVQVGVGSTYIPMGYFTIDDVPKVRNTINIVALDRMMFLDAEVKDTTIKGANRTITQYINRICTVCGLTLATNISSYPNATYSVPTFPEEVGITYRQLLSWCCQIMGKCAYVDWEGNLRIEFPGVNVLDPTSAIVGIAVVGLAIVGTGTAPTWIKETFDEAMRFESDMEAYSVTTTGVVHIDGENNETIVGTEDYAFDLSGNGLIQNATILQNLGDVIGIRYVPFTATTIPCPWLMPMDYVIYQKDGQNYSGLLTSVTFHLNGHTEIASVGESQKARSYARRGAVTAATRLVLERKVAELNTAIDNAMDEAVLNATQLITSTSGGYVVLHDKDNDGHVDEILIMDTEDISTAQKVWRWNENGLGYSSTGYNGTYGLAMTSNGQIVADFITTGHMSADHIQGGTLTLGGANDVNGVIQLKDASGNAIGTFGKDGLLITTTDNVSYNYIQIVNNTSSNGSFESEFSASTFYQVHILSSGNERIISMNDANIQLTSTSGDQFVGNILLFADASADGAGIRLERYSNGAISKSITITPDCNVAELSYTVVSTF